MGINRNGTGKEFDLVEAVSSMDIDGNVPTRLSTVE